MFPNTAKVAETLATVLQLLIVSHQAKRTDRIPDRLVAGELGEL
jgi:hypothetical protein